MSCCGWLGPHWICCGPQKRDPHHQSTLESRAQIYKVPRLDCHGSCHLSSQLFNKNAICVPTATIGRRHFSCLCLWTFPHLLCCFLFEGTVVLVLLPIPASTQEFLSVVRSAALGNATQSGDVGEVFSSQPLFTHSAGYGYTFSFGIPNPVLEKFHKYTTSQEIVDWKLHSKCCESVCHCLFFS